MTLKQLIEKLKLKPNQQSEVEFLVIGEGGNIVCCELNGPSTADLMRVIAKKKGSNAKVE